MRFTRKTVLITGGTSGIGLATARRLVEEEARVIVTGVERSRLDDVAAQLGPGATGLRVDVRELEQIDAMVSAIKSSHQSLDAVFVNAGAGLAAPFDAVTEAQFDEQVALNFKGAFFVAQKTSPILARGGAIVFTTSFLDAVGAPGLAVLSATKAAVRSLVRTLAAELAPRGIRVNAVSPGPTSTPFHSKLGLSEDELARSGEAIRSRVPLGRFGDPSEIANAAAFLASEDASYMTGTEVVVDGGLSQI